MPQASVPPHAAGLSHSGEGAAETLPLDGSAMDREGLQATFELFNRMSTDLSVSYRALEAQVAHLNDELQRVNAQREKEARSREAVSARLSNLLDLLPGGVVVLDRWGVVSQINPAAEELLEKNLVGTKWLDIIADYFAPQKDDWHEISLKSGRRVSLSTGSLEAETGQIILLTDQTETRHLQQQLSRSERLSALGRMVSALAHQIRTPLSAALLYAGHLGERQLTAAQTQRFSKKIVARLHQLEQQLRDMLVFAKGDIKLTDTVALSDLFADLHEVVDVALSTQRIVFPFSAECADRGVVCNRQLLVGALANVLNNALQASPEEAEVRISLVFREAEVDIVIEDSGCGIPDEIMQRLQREEAFVSTKAQGTGLGLPVVRAVVKAHRGCFSIASVEQRGSVVTICLPSFKLAAD